MLYQFCRNSIETPVESRAQQCIDHDTIGFKHREMFLCLYEPDQHTRDIMQSCQVGLEIFGTYMPELQYTDTDSISPCSQKSCNRQPVAAIISLSAKDHKIIS